jgi:hypothetical protein
VHRLRCDAATETGRLLRILLLRLGTLSTMSGTRFLRDWSSFLLRWVMAGSLAQSSRDWLSSSRISLLAWWLPQAAILTGLFLAAPVRSAIWVLALAWMGTACILNARRCGRMHCRFTGPFYLAMIVPVLLLSLISSSLLWWLALAAFILIADKIIWWATERAWGKFC